MPSFSDFNFDKGLAYAISALALYAVAHAVHIISAWIMQRIKDKKNILPKIHLDPSSFICQGCSYNDFRHPEELFKHSVFGFIRLARAVTIPNLPISDAGRKLVFEDLLDIKFRVVCDQLTDWLKRTSPHMKELRGEVLSLELISLLASIVEAYEREGAAEGIPLEVIEKFRFWHGKRVNTLQDEIEMVCSSEWISEATHRVGFCMSVMEQVLRATVLDAEQALVSLNGSLCGKTYKGFVLGAPCHGKSLSGG